MVFALFVAFSMVPILLGTVTMWQITFDEVASDSDDLPQIVLDKVESIAEFTEKYPMFTSPDWDLEFADLARKMRASPMRTIRYTCGLAALLLILVGLSRFIQEYFVGTVGANVSIELARAMYARLMEQPVGYFEKQESGETLARFSNDVFLVNHGLSMGLIRFLSEPIKMVVLLSVSLYIDPWLTLLGVCVLPPIVLVLLRIGKKMRRSIFKSLQKVAVMTSSINETLSGIAIIKGYLMEDYEIARVGRDLTRLKRLLYRRAQFRAMAAPLTELIMGLGILGFVMLSAHRVMSGHLDPAEMVILFGSLALILDPVRKISKVNNQIQASVASAERIFEYMDLESAIVECPEPVALKPLQEHISLKDVRFSYDGKEDVLKGLDVDIKKGEVIALVGFSGAGKSTIIKLLPRFYDVTEGAITIDGVDIRKASFKSLREQISIVTQDTILFAASIRENITAGNTGYSDAQVREAAQTANAAEFIEDLPDGYDTVLTETGANLSGGQRQRLAIARAFIKDPAILIFDEATSSLDSESERLIQEALAVFMEGRTAIIIAHRLSTIQQADRILVIDGGCVVDEGSHDTLMSRPGLYRQLYNSQFHDGNSSEK
jgi:subfamily B ATP-binding cassette protein MsbA